ncbi:MAG: right-handed parallel beta-helix repeat-containing protein [bacterium]|nr:right-handed parallel beta-helix repeat-containing protein [bacterium]
MIRTILTLVLALTSFAFAATIHVPGDQPTIQAGVDAALDNDTVFVAPGDYAENIIINSKSISLISDSGATMTIIRPFDSGERALHLPTNLNHAFLLKGFTFTGSNGHACVEIYRGDAGVYDNIFEDNDVDDGAIFLYYCGGTVMNNVFRNNRGTLHGGGIRVASWSPMLIAGNTITGNTATYGAGINALGARYATVRNNILVDNHALSGGGGIYLANPDAFSNLVHDNTIVNCSSGNNTGGGICFAAADGDTAYNNIVVSCQGNGLWAATSVNCYFDYNCLFNNSPGDYSGVIYGPNAVYADPQFVGGDPFSYELMPSSPCIDAGNPETRFNDLDGSRNDIGAVLVETPAVPKTIRVPADQPTIQAAVDVANDGDTILVAPGEYSENVVIVFKSIVMISDSGAAATILRPLDPSQRALHLPNNSGFEFTLRGFTFTGSNGHTCVEIYLGNAVVSDNVFEDNDVDDGAIFLYYCGGTVKNNAFRNNRGTSHGGGIRVASWSPMLIEANTITGNTAKYGAGINALGARYATIRNNLIVDNHASMGGGGLYLANPDAYNNLVHDNTIVDCSSGDNTGGGICFAAADGDTAYNNIVVNCQGNGIWAASSINCYFDYNCLFNNVPGDYSGVVTGPNGVYADPMFVGGNPFSFDLMPFSPCIDKGNPDPMFNDLDGSRNDIGAFPVIAYVLGDADGNGTVNVSDAVFLLNYIFAFGPAPIPPAAGDPNCDGNCNISDVVYIINYIFSGGPAPCQK